MVPVRELQCATGARSLEKIEGNEKVQRGQSSNRVAKAPVAVVLLVVAFGFSDGVVPPAVLR